MSDNHSKTDKNLWDNHCVKWQFITSPLRPSAQDIALFQKQISNKNCCGLILGATCELQNLTNKICAIDNNLQMLQLLAPLAEELICQNWQNMTPGIFANAPFSYIFADGSFNVIAFEDWPLVLERILALLKKDGKLIARFFIAPNQAEEIENIMALAYGKNIANFSAFKWHFAMALAAKKQTPNISVSYIHQTFKYVVVNREEFAKKTGWPLEAINTIDHYRNCQSIYSFPTLEQMKSVMEKYLRIICIDYGNYYLADRCPIITFAAR